MSVEVVISLSSIPPRFGQLRPTLTSLVQQNQTADAVLLWVPHRYRRFPDWDGTLPTVPEGVTILRCDEDFGPATKVLPSIFHYAGTKTKIAFCDDDKIYGASWLSTLLAISDEKPGHCIAGSGEDIPGDIGHPHRPAHRLPRLNSSTSIYVIQTLMEIGRMMSGRRLTVRSSGFVDMLKGYAGVLIEPKFLSSCPQDIPPVLWAVDDVWLSGHLEINNIPIWMDTRIPYPANSPMADNAHGLMVSEIDGYRREAANRVAVAYFRKTYGIWMPSWSERVLSMFRPGAARLSHKIKVNMKSLRHAAKNKTES